ncbi:hypothetical protein HYC85_010487 [Camellia sinensis]|uniref:Uncharacterized protein n=1 Tax=Camellia sinensis TaxID=4442 RepID=A0A7J7HI68_CAMSI|nr:hypothetical protein HYC85_010487 [Camellia sinensis]
MTGLDVRVVSLEAPVQTGSHRSGNDRVMSLMVSLTIRKTLFTQEKQKAEAVFSEMVNLKEAMLESKDAAEATLYLASDESKYVSDLNLVANGVYSTTNPTFGEAMNKLSS